MNSSAAKLNGRTLNNVGCQLVNTDGSAYNIYNGINGTNFMKMHIINWFIVNTGLCIRNFGKNSQTQIFHLIIEVGCCNHLLDFKVRIMMVMILDFVMMMIMIVHMLMVIINDYLYPCAGNAFPYVSFNL